MNPVQKRTAMNRLINSQSSTRQKSKQKSHRLLYAATALSLILASAPAQAEISNTASASGTFNGTPYPSNDATVDVTVQQATPALVATKAGGTVNYTVIGDADLQAGDTITYTIGVDNTGNVTMTNILPDDDGITFGASAGTGTYAYSPVNFASLAPTDTPVSFTVTYTLTALDIIRGAAAGLNGVSNSAHATGTFNSTTTDSPISGPVLTTIPTDPELVIVKTFVLTKAVGNSGTDAEPNDTIVYTYAVENTGNVAIDDVTINDDHEGTVLATSLFAEDVLTLSDGPLANSDDVAVDGSWDLLGPGAKVNFTYTHTVTQTEFDNQ
jgi:hypothetical protein